jgi:uncharacterized membrane protein
VVAGIMWIGNSLLFNWLDRNLRPAAREDATAAWARSGCCTAAASTRSRRRSRLGDVSDARPLHWFKWQAYTTWLSGAALLVAVYYATAARCS